MVTVTLRHTGPLGLPRGPVLRPGVATNVPDWHIQQHHPVVRQWVDVGVLVVEGEDQEEPRKPFFSPLDHDQDGRKGGSKPIPKTEDEDRDRLKAEAKDLGIAVHYRWSKERIQEEIDKKLAE